MSKMKKIILLLVEGITDQVALEAILPVFVENENITFKITEGDITTKDGVDSHNILKNVYRPIKNFLDRGHFQKKDLLQVIHLIDTDGAFVDESAVQYKEIEHIQYYLDHIETKDVNYIRQRNKNKAESLIRLASTPKIGGIPYSIYFFSSNLEHVLHNIQKELSKEEKMKLAEEFSDLYEDNPKEFLTFLESAEFAVPGTYRESWEFIKENCHSLQRYCNFHLFFQSESFEGAFTAKS